MKNLTLFGKPFKNVYLSSECFAFIFYSDGEYEKNPDGSFVTDDDGNKILQAKDKDLKPIGNTFLEEGREAALKKDLTTNIIPALKNTFSNAGYVLNVGSVNNAPQPCLAIEREDRQPIGKHNLNELTTLFNKRLAEINAKENSEKKNTYKDRFFHTTKKMEPEGQEEKQHKARQTK